MLSIVLLSVAPHLAGLASAVPHPRPPGVTFLTQDRAAPPSVPAPASTARTAAIAGTDSLTPVRTEAIVVDSRIEVIRPEQILYNDGFAFYAALEKTQGLPADSDTGSDCRLLENGTPLGPARAPGDQIVSAGRGAFSHWATGQLFFSTSDNSSPLSNGRTYTLDCTRTIVVGRSAVTTTGPVGIYSLAASGATAWNRRLVIRNSASSPAIRPALRVQGEPDLSTREGILAGILAPGLSTEAQAIAIWKLLADQAYNWHPAQDDDEVHDPVKFVNVYGYGYCDDFANGFSKLARLAGLPSRIWYLEGHVVPEVWYEGAWHMFDPDFAIFYRAPDGHVLGVEELAADPQPILDRADYLGGWMAARLAAIFASTSDNFVVDPPETASGHRMDLVLQPGDELAFDGGPASVTRRIFLPAAPAAPVAGNGTLRRTIPLAGNPSQVVIPFAWPYVLVGGTVTGEGTVAISADGTSWTETRDFQSWFASRSQASYGFQLRVTNPRPGLALEVVFQFAPFSLPTVKPGTTWFDLVVEPADASAGTAATRLEVFQEWEERPPAGAYAIAANAVPPEAGTAVCTPDPVIAGGTSTCTATAQPGFTFAGWSGDCSGPQCVLTGVTGVRGVTASFQATQYAIAATAAPVGSGTVSCTPDSVMLGGTSTCTATAATGFAFAGWSGDCSGAAACVLENVTGARSVTANFSAIAYPITGVANPAAGGTVSCAPNPVPHGGTSTCVAIANPGFAFAGWSAPAACTGTAPCLLTVTAPASLKAEFTEVAPPPSRLVNLSTRVNVLTGNNVLIGGIVIGGSSSKTVVIRARGPSLAPLGVANALPDPAVELYSGQTLIASNVNWRESSNSAVLEATGFAPADDREAAILLTLAPGAYTAVMSGVDGTTGVGLVEVFEVEQPDAPLANLSSRGSVSSTANPMIAGFVIQGKEPQTVVVRARGPSLAGAGVTDYLVNPVLVVYAGSRAIAVNDDWQTLGNAAELVASGYAPNHPAEAAVMLTLPPGAYTAVVNGTGASSGVAIVEVFAR